MSEKIERAREREREILIKRRNKRNFYLFKQQMLEKIYQKDWV